jgi:hypothetical protein
LFDWTVQALDCTFCWLRDRPSSDNGDAEQRRRDSIEEYWTRVLASQARHKHNSGSAVAQQQLRKQATDANLPSQSRLLWERVEQLEHMNVAHATAEHVNRTREQCVRASAIDFPIEIVSLPQAVQAHTTVFLRPTHGLNELELLLLEHRRKPVPLLVAIRAAADSRMSGLPGGLTGAMSVAAFALWANDRELAVCLSIELDPGFEVLAAVYCGYEVALYASHRLEPVLQGLVDLQPYGGWDSFHELLREKAHSMDTFVCRRVKAPMSPNDSSTKHMICAAPQVLYHELHEHRLIPFSAPLKATMSPIAQPQCALCTSQLSEISASTSAMYVCPDCCFMMCDACSKTGSAVSACSHTKRLQLNHSLTFKAGTVRLEESCEPELDQMARLLKEYPIPLCVEGYANYVRPDGTIADDNTINRGEEQCTLYELAGRRAHKVIDCLAERGVSRSLLSPTAAGIRKLVTINRTPANLRVELYWKP